MLSGRTDKVQPTRVLALLQLRILNKNRKVAQSATLCMSCHYFFGIASPTLTREQSSTVMEVTYASDGMRRMRSDGTCGKLLIISVAVSVGHGAALFLA